MEDAANAKAEKPQAARATCALRLNTECATFIRIPLWERAYHTGGCTWCSNWRGRDYFEHPGYRMSRTLALCTPMRVTMNIRSYSPSAIGGIALPLKRLTISGMVFE